MKILLATHNPGKIIEYKDALAKIGVSAVTLDELKIKDEFEENGATFEDNAKGKAVFYYQLSNIPTLADDGGFEIDYFKGEPGVKSRRWLGHAASDREIVDHLRKIIPTIPEDQRNARFVAVTCLVKSPSEIHVFKNTKEGFITNDIRDDYPKGLPYRSCFVSSVLHKHLSDLTAEEEATISHRFKNLESLKKYLID